MISWNLKELKLHVEPLLTYTYIDIYDKQNSHDKKKIDTIKQICEKDVFLKPDKDNKLVMKNNLKFKNN